MRETKTRNGFKVHAIAGTYVVLFGFDLPKSDCNGLLGFTLHRVDHTENESYYLEANKFFAGTNPGLKPGEQHSTKDHPIQSFQWADYTAKPGHKYTYTITAQKGAPGALAPHAEVVIDIKTESPEARNHDVYFNRGVAGSQAYVRRFGDRSPDEVENGQAFVWLSRGLYEAMEGFVSSAKAGRHALRIAAYEFNYAPFLTLLQETKARGVDIEIVYDARKDQPGDKNREAASDARITGACTERTEGSYISHNKFIVKLEGDTPVSVWTGGTNFSENGIFGHSNVAHVVEDNDIAAKYLEYWKLLAGDPTMKDAKAGVEALTTVPEALPKKGTSVIFGPRKNLDALNWYAKVAMGAKSGLFMTFAFGMNDLFKDVYRNSTASFRLALMEKKTRPMAKGPKRTKEEKAIQDLRSMPENLFAIGSLIQTNEFDGWVKERLTGLSKNVQYVHNKFMLVDPLSNDPIVIAGSANFSDASTTNNDENMLVVRGNTRVADIYLGEFMRLYTHHAFRESLGFKDNKGPKPLSTDDWWRDYYGNTARSVRRKFFAQ